jgi:phosphohistidine phosphatase SixA
MRLILVRHAEAASGEPDDLRPLTPAGREAARVLGERLRAESPDAILSSPLLRARETAAAIATAAGIESEAEDRLGPGATADDIRAAVTGRGETVVAVCHQPDCGLAMVAFTGREVAFPPGGSAEVEL